MENGSETQGNVIGRIRETGCGAANERRHAYERQPGSRPGTYSAPCMICEGKGCLRTKGIWNIWETCLTCGGEGTVERDGEREGDSDRRTQPTWGDVLRFSLMVAFFTAFGCYLLYTYAKVH